MELKVDLFRSEPDFLLFGDDFGIGGLFSNSESILKKLIIDDKKIIVDNSKLRECYVSIN